MKDVKIKAWNPTLDDKNDRMSPPMILAEWLSQASNGAHAFVGHEDEVAKFYRKLVYLESTGVKDMKGAEMYEGDIVKCTVMARKMGVIAKERTPDADEEAAELTAADPGTAVERAAKLLVPETVREAVKQDPDRVRMLHQVLGTALTEAGLIDD